MVGDMTDIVILTIIYVWEKVKHTFNRNIEDKYLLVR